jgi:hypothetical protein
LDDVLEDPVLEVHSSGGDLIAANDNWRDDSASALELATIGLTPLDDHESALVTMLSLRHGDNCQ